MGRDQWRTESIGALIEGGTILAHKDGNYGSNYPRTNEFGPSGVPLLTAKALDDVGGRIDFDSAPRLNVEKAYKLTYGFIETGDVLLSHNATVGRVAVVPTLTERILVGTSLTYYRVDPTRLLPRYLAAFFAGRDFQNQLKSVMSHSTRNQVPITTQRRLTIVLPPLPEQRAIAHILGSLDDKIELNRRMNGTLEGMAQALFKSWFVDFDPVIDNALAAGNPIPEELADRAEVRRAALADGTANREAAKPFPAAFQQTEGLGWIPEGWEMTTFGKFAVNVRDSVDPTELPPETPYVGLEHIDRKNFSLSRWGYASDVDSQKSQFRSTDFLFGKLRPYFHKVCQVQSSGICSTDILVIRPKVESLRGFVGCQIFEPEFVEYANMRSTGTRMPRASWNDIAKYEIALPTGKLIETFNNLIEPSRQKCKRAVDESHELTKLRDTLLPKLISGELRIPDAEKLAEAALA